MVDEARIRPVDQDAAREKEEQELDDVNFLRGSYASVDRRVSRVS